MFVAVCFLVTSGRSNILNLASLSLSLDRDDGLDTLLDLGQVSDDQTPVVETLEVLEHDMDLVSRLLVQDTEPLVDHEEPSTDQVVDGTQSDPRADVDHEAFV